MNLYGSKKGQMQNYFVVMAFLFTFGFLSILGYYILDTMVTAFAATGVWTSTMADVSNSFLLSIQILDYVIVIFMVVFMIAIALTTYKLRTKPAFFIVSIILSVFLGITGYMFNYLFIQLVNRPIFTAALLFFPKTVLILTNMHWVGLITFTIGSIALYAKKDTDETSGLVQQ